MKALLGLLLLLGLLTSGYSLECETCEARSTDCTGPKMPCHAGETACVSILIQVVIGPRSKSIKKSCDTENECKDIEDGGIRSYVGANVVTVQCSKPPVPTESSSKAQGASGSSSKPPGASGSFFLALSSLLLLKLLW